MAINWGGTVDELVASWARPYTVYASVTTLCICALFIPATRVEVMPILGTIAGGVTVLRTWDKKIAANATNPQPTSAGKTG